MSIHYLDASAWVKRYVGEEGSQRVNAWMNQNPLVASAALGVTEVLSVIVRKARAGELSEPERDQILDDVWGVCCLRARVSYRTGDAARS